MEPELERWVREELEVVDITAERERPWAAVWRLTTRDGLWWAKVNSPATGYEGRLLGYLAGLGAPVPQSRARAGRPWALTADAGRPAQEVLDGADPTAVLDFWCELLTTYARWQRLTAASALLGIGVPDVRPATLVGQFDTLVNSRQWFRAEYAPAFTDGQRERVLAARSELARLAGELAQGVPPTVQHDDLHGSNVFVDAGTVRIIDWGDAVLAHPFGTLRVTLDALAHQLGWESSDRRLRRVSDAYLEAWLTGGQSRAELRAQLDLSLRVAGLGRALGWARALGTPEAGLQLGYADAVARWMQQLADDLLGGPGEQRHR